MRDPRQADFASDNDFAAVIIANAPALPRTSPHFFALPPVSLTKRFLASPTLCSEHSCLSIALRYARLFMTP
jgi:hypothetical protein